jgi:hypothetical protein
MLHEIDRLEAAALMASLPVLDMLLPVNLVDKEGCQKTCWTSISIITPKKHKENQTISTRSCQSEWLLSSITRMPTTRRQRRTK